MSPRINAVGFGSGLAASAATVSYDVVQILQIGGVLRFPADEALIYGTSLLIVIPFLFEILALHHLTSPERRFWTHASLVFAILYAVFVTANYVVQLATVIPAKLGGDSGSLRILEQTPHSLFWDYDAIGYVCMGLAGLSAVPAIGRTGFEKWVRLSLIANALVTPLIGTVYFYRPFSAKLLFLGFPWALTAPLFMLMVALMLKNREFPTAPS